MTEVTEMPDEHEYTFTVHSVMEREVTVRVVDGEVEVIHGEEGPSDYDPFLDGEVYDDEMGEWYNRDRLADVLDDAGINDAGNIADRVVYR